MTTRFKRLGWLKPRVSTPSFSILDMHRFQHFQDSATTMLAAIKSKLFGKPQVQVGKTEIDWTIWSPPCEDDGTVLPTFRRST